MTAHATFRTLVKTACIAAIGGFLCEFSLLAAFGQSISLASPSADKLLFNPLPSLPAANAARTVAPESRLESASKLTGIVESGFRIAALILGGVFAYWKFFMGRTFNPRLEPAVSASARVEESKVFLTVCCKLKNVGLSSIDLDQPKSSLRVLLTKLDASAQKVKEVRWPKESAFTTDVFKRHEWIEGGETIEDVHLFAFPYAPDQACRVELRVLRVRRNLRERFREWNRRRQRPNAWSQHTILDKLTHEPITKNGTN